MHNASRKFLIAAVVVYLAQQAIWLGNRWVDDETWYVIPAQTFLTEGRIRIPVFNDAHREFWPYPPLLSVLEALSWRMHKLNVVQARALTVAFGAGTILATFALARRLFDERVAAVAACFCSVENMLFLAGRTVRPESLVVFFTVAAMWLLLKSVQDGTLWPLVLAGLSVGAGMSTHPNGAAASLCGVALLWVFEGWSFLRRRRIYVFTLFCILGFLPLVRHFVASDAETGYKGFASLVSLRPSDGSAFDRLSNTLAREISVRYRLFAARPYRVHLALLSLAAAIFGLFSRNRSTRFAALCVVIHVLWFALVINVNKSPRYLTLAMPFVCILWAQWVVALWGRAELRSPPHPQPFLRQGGRENLRALAALLLCAVIGLTQLGGNVSFLWKNRHADIHAVCREIDALIPPRSTIYGGMAFWIGFLDHTYVPYMRMPWTQAIEEFDPNIVILDDWVMAAPNDYGEWNELRSELQAYVADHGRLLGQVSNPFYGDLKIYEVERP